MPSGWDVDGPLKSLVLLPHRSYHSLHCAADNGTVLRFGRDDVIFWMVEGERFARGATAHLSGDKSIAEIGTRWLVRM